MRGGQSITRARAGHTVGRPCKMGPGDLNLHNAWLGHVKAGNLKLHVAGCIPAWLHVFLPGSERCCAPASLPGKAPGALRTDTGLNSQDGPNHLSANQAVFVSISASNVCLKRRPIPALQHSI